MTVSCKITNIIPIEFGVAVPKKARVGGINFVTRPKANAGTHVIELAAQNLRRARLKMCVDRSSGRNCLGQNFVEGAYNFGRVSHSRARSYTSPPARPAAVSSEQREETRTRPQEGEWTQCCSRASGYVVVLPTRHH